MSIKKVIVSFAVMAITAGNVFAQGGGWDWGGGGMENYCPPNNPIAPSREFTIDEMLQTGLPVIIINTENNTPITSKEYFINIESFEVKHPNNPYLNFLRRKGDDEKSGRIADEIRGRGNASWCKWGHNYPKKPYRFRFTEQRSLLGLPEARNWVLLAEYRDPSHIFNALAFHVAKNVFNMPFTHNYIHVHLFLNGDYRGLYGLTEHKQVHKNRINIDEKEGWYVNVDDYYDEDPKFRTNQYQVPVMIKSPEIEGVTDVNNEAFRFVRDDWNDLTNRMRNWDFPDNGYRDLIDMTSLADFLLVNEVTQNEELGHEENIRSVLVYKDKGGKITFGPVWDFDCGFGYDYQSTHRYFQSLYNHRFIAKVDFLERFYEDPHFTSKIKGRWNENYDKLTQVNGYIDEISNKIRNAVGKDHERWLVDNNSEKNNGYVAQEYTKDHSEMIRKLKEWWTSRIQWLNNEINNRYQMIETSLSPERAAIQKRAAAPSAQVIGKTLRVSSPDNLGSLNIKLIDVKGKVRASFNTANGSGNFSLKRIPAGKYFAEMKSAGGVKRTVPVVVR